MLWKKMKWYNFLGILLAFSFDLHLHTLIYTWYLFVCKCCYSLQNGQGFIIIASAGHG